MTALLAASLSLLMIFTALLSGVFGMAGGLILVCMMLMLVPGVTGPLLDPLFLRSPLDRKQIVAPKAACQLFSHSLKLAYFGALIEQSGSVEPWFAAIAVASSMIGTSAGKLVLEKLTATQFPAWSNPIIPVIATYYIGYAVVLLTGIAQRVIPPPSSRCDAPSHAPAATA